MVGGRSKGKGEFQWNLSLQVMAPPEVPSCNEKKDRTQSVSLIIREMHLPSIPSYNMSSKHEMLSKL